MKNRKISFKNNVQKKKFWATVYIVITIIATFIVYYFTKNLGNTVLVIAVSILLYFMFTTLVQDKLKPEKVIDNKKEQAINFYRSIYENTIADVDFKNAFMKSLDKIFDESKRNDLTNYIQSEKIIDLPPKLYSSTKETLVRISLYNMARVKVVRKENLRKYKASLDNFAPVKNGDERIFYSFLYLGFAIYLFEFLMMIVKGI